MNEDCDVTSLQSLKRTFLYAPDHSPPPPPRPHSPSRREGGLSLLYSWPCPAK